MEIWSNKGRCKLLQAALLLDYFWLLTNKPPHTKRVSLCSIKKKIVVFMSLLMILSQVPRYNYKIATHPPPLPTLYPCCPTKTRSETLIMEQNYYFPILFHFSSPMYR